MEQIEITVKASLSPKTLTKIITRTCVAAVCALGVLSQVDFAQFKTVQNPVNTTKTIKTLPN